MSSSRVNEGGDNIGDIRHSGNGDDGGGIRECDVPLRATPIEGEKVFLTCSVMSSCTHLYVYRCAVACSDMSSSKDLSFLDRLGT